MPRVPMPDGPSAQLSGSIQGRLVAPEINPIAARQTEAMGNALQGMGEGMAKIATDMQQQANTVRTLDAMNQLKETALTLQHDKDAGFVSVKGKDAFDRPDGRSLTDVYAEQLSNRASDIAAGLGNDAQRAAFQQQAGGLMVNFRGQVMAHESQERLGYKTSVYESVAATSRRDIALNWNNPEAVDAAMQRSTAAVFELARLTGKSAEWQDYMVRKTQSDGHKVALLTALENGNTAYAEGYLKQFKGQMDESDILAVQGNITKAVNTQEGMAAANTVMGRMQPRVAPTDMDKMVNITVQSESGGNPNAVSSAGATGLMQVMPETAKNPGFGIKPSNGTPEDTARVGRDLLGELVKKYGDAGKAWAAYNAGHKWVDEAQERAAKAVPGTQQADWFWQLNNDARTPANRQQTQDYVIKNVAALASGGGQPSRPTFADIDASLRADPHLAGNPERLKIARQEAERQYEAQTKAIKQRDDDAVAEAMRQVQVNGGRFSDLPAAVQAAIPPKERDNVMNYAARIAKGDDVTSPLLYQRLTENPAYLKNLSESQFFALRRELSDADFKHFSNERAKLLGVKSAGQGGAGDLNTAAINAGLSDRLRQLKQDPTPKDGSEDAARLGTLRKVVNDYFARQQQEAGKKFSDAEVNQHLDALFAKNTEVRGWFSNSSVPVLGMKPGDIPSAERDQVKAALKRNGIDNPSDQQVLETYMRGKFTRFPQQARAEIPR